MKRDSEIFALIEKEHQRQVKGMELIASENYVSDQVMEAMGFKARVKDAEDQLSGIGFSSTVRNDLVVKVKGMTERTMRIKF